MKRVNIDRAKGLRILTQYVTASWWSSFSNKELNEALKRNEFNYSIRSKFYFWIKNILN